jgi:hypothetical protein
MTEAAMTEAATTDVSCVPLRGNHPPGEETIAEYQASLTDGGVTESDGTVALRS